MPAAKGDIYWVARENGLTPHYYVVLEDPHVDGTFLLASLTDRSNINEVRDIWPTGYAICRTVALSKPSIVAMQYIHIGSDQWLNERSALYLCSASPATIQRMCCNLHWYRKFLRPPTLKRLNFHGSSWTQPCGAPPQ